MKKIIVSMAIISLLLLLASIGFGDETMGMCELNVEKLTPNTTIYNVVCMEPIGITDNVLNSHTKPHSFSVAISQGFTIGNILLQRATSNQISVSQNVGMISNTLNAKNGIVIFNRFYFAVSQSLSMLHQLVSPSTAPLPVPDTSEPIDYGTVAIVSIVAIGVAMLIFKNDIMEIVRGKPKVEPEQKTEPQPEQPKEEEIGKVEEPTEALPEPIEEEPKEEPESSLQIERPKNRRKKS
jgi:hypothetical protein